MGDRPTQDKGKEEKVIKLTWGYVTYFKNNIKYIKGLPFLTINSQRIYFSIMQMISIIDYS